MSSLGDEPGFIFWGLFLILGLWVALYWLWMRWAEQRDRERDGDDP